MLPRNVGGVDRAVRLVLGAILFSGGLFLLFGKSSLGVIVAAVGLLVLLTGVVRFCALYLPFDISTAHSAASPQPMCDCQTWRKEMQAKPVSPDLPPHPNPAAARTAFRNGFGKGTTSQAAGKLAAASDFGRRSASALR